MKYININYLFILLILIVGNINANENETITLQSDANLTEQSKVKIGLYVVSIHDLNFSNNTFGADFWIWTNYENSRLEPLKTIEFVNAKSISQNLQIIQHNENKIWSQKKVQGYFRHSWDMSNFPFDRHILSIILEEGVDYIENFQYLPDMKNTGYARDITIDGFSINKMIVNTAYRDYESNFGDSNAPSKSRYTRLIVNLELERVSRILFLKLHTALYAAFLFTAFCFPLLPQIIKVPQMLGSILSAIVGSLFASIINLRSADAVIGRSESLTLVDRLHFVTFIYFIFLGIIAIGVLVNRERWDSKKIYLFSRFIGLLYVSSYILINLALIWQAAF